MILYDVLRLYPPVIDLTNIVHEDTKLGPYTIPAGTQIMLPSVMIHREKSIWGEDAMEFNPERSIAFLAFGWGPRVCLGQNFALVEAKLGLVMILQRFSFDVSPSYAHAPYTILTIQPQLGSHVIYKKLR